MSSETSKLAAQSRRTREIGNRIWALFDLDSKAPLPARINLNSASSYVISCLHTSLARTELPKQHSKLLAVSGDVRLPGNQFRESQLLAVSKNLDIWLRKVLKRPAGWEEPLVKDQYTIQLRLFDDRATAEKWWESYSPPARERARKVVSKERKKSESSKGGIGSDRQQALAQLLDKLPESFDKCHAQLLVLKHAFHEKLASELGPRLDAHLTTLPQESYAEKQSIATWVNSRLRDLGLAIKCPKTGRPGNLVADLKQAGSDISRFRLEVRDETGKRSRTIAVRTLPALELMVDEARQEPLLEWSQRVKAEREANPKKER